MTRERAVVFDCAGNRLVGILHRGGPAARTGVVFVVGGPQYRVGSHRQFVLMARHLASAGIPVLRFDYRGMGDAEGTPRTFETVSDDIRAAIDCLTQEVSDVTTVVLLGLCDAASANLIYAHTDARVTGLILLNPWVRTLAGEAKTYLKQYYLRRLLQKAFWSKVFSGQLAFTRSWREFAETRRAAHSASGSQSSTAQPGERFISRMLVGLEQFRQPILFLISERDLTAQEFINLTEDNEKWRKKMSRPGIIKEILPDADHTLSKSAHLLAASERCVRWLHESDNCTGANIYCDIRGR